jgi:hypothetical protein
MARSVAAKRRLLEHSLHMALSAIEIYNKPDFKAWGGRPQTQGAAIPLARNYVMLD